MKSVKIVDQMMFLILTLGFMLSCCHGRSSGPVVRPLAAWRSPTDESQPSTPVAVQIDVGCLSSHYSEHAADEFEFDGVELASVCLALGTLALVIGPEIGVMVYGAAGTLSQHSLDFIVPGSGHMVAASDRCPGAVRQRRDAAELGILACGPKTGEVTGRYDGLNGVHRSDAGNGYKQTVIVLYGRILS